LERLLRYGLRNPFSQKRLSLTADGKVKLKLRKPDYLGQQYVLFDPVEFLRRLAAIIPPPRQNQIRFHGVFAPHFKHHEKIKALVPQPKIQEKCDMNVCEMQEECAPAEAEESSGHRPYRRLWAELLKRVFQTDGLECPKCKGRMKLIALIQEPSAISKICQHFGLPTELPSVSPGRAPPQEEFFE
jgi:hypothetical protein